MGLSFFVSGDLPSFAVLVKYAKYAPVKDGDIAIPYSGDSLNIPDCLTPYISFDEKTKTIKKLQSIKGRELNDLFEQNAIEDAELLHLIGNLNSVFKEGKTYRRCPFEEKISLQFDGNMAKTEVVNAKAYVTAVKHKISDGIYGITVMLVNNESIGTRYIFQPKIIIESATLEEKKFVPYNSIPTGNISEEELSLEMLYRKKIVYGTGHGVAVDWSIDNGIGEIFTEYMPTYEVPKINLDLRREISQEEAVKDRALSMKYLSDLDGTSKDEKLSDIISFIDCYKAWIDRLEDERRATDFSERYKIIAGKHISRCREAYARMVAGIDILKTNEVAWKAFVLANRAMFMQRIHGEFQQQTHYPNDENWQESMAAVDYSSYPEDKCRWRPFQLAFFIDEYPFDYRPFLFRT